MYAFLGGSNNNNNDPLERRATTVKAPAMMGTIAMQHGRRRCAY